MSIRDKRLSNEIDNVIRENLSKGYVPTSNEVISELSKYMASNNLNAPSFKFKLRNKNFTAAMLNEAKEMTLGDLKIIYDALLELHRSSDEQIEKYEIDKKKYDYMLASLESELTTLINRYSDSGYAASYREGFSDMERIDLTRTTADIDIVNHEAILEYLDDIPYTNFSVRSYVTDDTTLFQNGDISSYISATGLVWQGIVEKDLQELTSIYITIDLKGLQSVNKLEAEIPVLKKCTAVVCTSIDSDNWVEVQRGEITNRLVVNFTGSFQYIRIELFKTEADKVNLTRYQYYFLVDTIKLSTMEYTMTSDVVSKPIGVTGNIHKVSIIDSSVTAPTTSVQYYISHLIDVPEWIPISPLNAVSKPYQDVITFDSVETDQHMNITLPSGISNDAYEMKHLSVNGQRIFAIGEIEGKTISRYKLYKGIRAWKIETLAQALGGIPQTLTLFIQNYKDLTTTYSPIVTDKAGLVLNNVQFATSSVRKYTTTIYRESSDTIEKAMLASSHPVTVYLNGNIVYKGTPAQAVMVTYPFRKGLNTLEVLVNIFNTSAVYVDLNLNILSLGSMVCANKDPMQSVSMFNLRYNTNNQYDVYTLYEANGKSVIIIKDPDLTISYDLVYDYVSEPIDRVIIKATLEREHSSMNITPRLLSYEIRFV